MIDEKWLIDELKQSGMIVDNEYGNALVSTIDRLAEGKRRNMSGIVCDVTGCNWNDGNGVCGCDGIYISDAETGDPMCESASFPEDENGKLVEDEHGKKF